MNVVEVGGPVPGTPSDLVACDGSYIHGTKYLTWGAVSGAGLITWGRTAALTRMSTQLAEIQALGASLALYPKGADVTVVSDLNEAAAVAAGELFDERRWNQELRAAVSRIHDHVRRLGSASVYPVTRSEDMTNAQGLLHRVAHKVAYVAGLLSRDGLYDDPLACAVMREVSAGAFTAHSGLQPAYRSVAQTLGLLQMESAEPQNSWPPSVANTVRVMISQGWGEPRLSATADAIKILGTRDDAPAIQIIIRFRRRTGHGWGIRSAAIRWVASGPSGRYKTVARAVTSSSEAVLALLNAPNTAIAAAVTHADRQTVSADAVAATITDGADGAALEFQRPVLPQSPASLAEMLRRSAWRVTSSMPGSSVVRITAIRAGNPIVRLLLRYKRQAHRGWKFKDVRCDAPIWPGGPTAVLSSKTSLYALARSSNEEILGLLKTCDGEPVPVSNAAALGLPACSVAAE
jgi:hypothetical protein